MFPPPRPKIVGVCNQITLLILYYISCRLVTIRKVIDAPIQVPIFFILLLVSSSSILAFIHAFCLSLKCLLATHLTLLYAFFWVIPRRMKFIFRRFGTLCLFHLHSTRTYLPMKMEQSVPKRRHINFRRRRITQKKAYSIQYTAKVWNQDYILHCSCYLHCFGLDPVPTAF